MHTEDRLQATLNFTLRNAFETLNKFSVWASTDESTVQFNLIDAFPDGSGYTGNGMAVEPIVIPSLSAVNGDLFGKSNTTVNKIFFWNLDFKNDKGWTFSKDTGKNLQTNILGDSRPLLKLDTVDFYVSDSSKSVFDGGVFASSLYINPDKYSKTDDNDYEFSYDSEEQRVFGIANIVDIRNGTDYGSTINLVPSKYINTLMYYSNIDAQHKSIYAISYCPNNSTYDRYNGTPYNIISFNPSVSSQGSYAVIEIGNGVDKTLNIITKGRELQQTFDVAYSTIGGVFNSISSNYARVLSPIDSEYDITLGVNSSKGTILQSLLEKARTITFDTYTENSSTSFNYINLTCFDTTSDNSKIEVKSSGDVEISGLNKLVLASSNVQIKGAIDDENSLISVKNNIVSIPTLFDKSKSQYRLSGVQTFRGSIVNPNLILAGINNSIVTENEPLFSADFTRTAIDEGDVFDDFKVSAISETETYFVTKKTRKDGKTIFNIHLRNSSNISTTDTNNWSVYLEDVQVKDFILIKNKIYFIGIIGDKNQITINNSDGTTAWKGLDKINLYSFDITDYSQNGKKIELDNLILEDLIEEYDSVPFQDANSDCRGLSSFITSSDSFTFSDFNENYIVIARNCKINRKMELTCQILYDKEGDWTQAGLVATPDIITPYVLLYDISKKSVHVVAAEIYADMYDGMEYFYDIKSVKIIDNYCNDYSETNKNKDLCSINPKFDEIYISKNNNVGRFVITENGVQTFNDFDITKETNSSYIAESSIEAFKTRYANYTALNYNPGVCLMMNLRWNFACFTTSFSSLCAVSISKSDKNIIMVKEMNKQDIYSDASLKLIGKCLETSSNHSLSDVNILNATSTCDILDNIENTNSLVLYKTDNLYDNGSYNISKSYAKTNYISQDDENSPYYMCTSTTLYNKNTLNYIYYVLNTMYLNYSLDSSIKKLSIGSSDSSEYKFDFNDNSQTTPSISIENIISETEDYSLCGALSNLVYDSYTFSNYRRSNTIVSKKDEEYYISSFSVAKQDSTFEPKYNGVMVGDSYESVFGTNTISIDSDNVYYYTLNKTYGTDDLVSNSITVRCNKEKSSTKKYIIYITKNGTDIQIDELFTGEEKEYDPGCVDIRNSYIDYINVDIDPVVGKKAGVESPYIYTDLAFGYSIRDEDPQKSIFSSSKSNDIFTDFRISNAGVIDVVSGLNFNSYKESDDSIPYFDKSILESDGLIAIQKEGTKLIRDKTIYTNQFGVHVGIISYVVNHMKTKDETIRHHSGYAIKYSNTFSRFEIYYENNKYSGYKQPFAYYKNDSVAYSTSNQNDILKTNTINLPENNCYIADTISGRAYIYITSTNVYVTNYMHTIVLRISLNALSSSREGNIIDEFGDTCSMKANYLCGGYTFYETSIGDYIGKIVLGLTEVAQVGVDCD